MSNTDNDEEPWTYCLGCGNEVPPGEGRVDHTCGDYDCIENVRVNPEEPL